MAADDGLMTILVFYENSIQHCLSDGLDDQTLLPRQDSRHWFHSASGALKCNSAYEYLRQ